MMAVVLIPFVQRNGVPTGLSFWGEPQLNLASNEILDQIVWYNNDHNVEVRVFTIPIEDFLYAFVLVGANISLFEYIGKSLD